MKSKSAQSARQGRRRYYWEKANRPKFGPVNSWQTDPQPITPDRRRMIYGY